MTSQKLTFASSRGESLAAALELPTGRPTAFALFAHCFTCSKDVAAASRISKALSARGIAVLRFDFTGLGNSEGDFANTSFSSNLEDIQSAADHLRAHYQAPELLIGHSLGGAAVLGVAPHIPEVRAVVTIGAPSQPCHLQRLFVDQLSEVRSEGTAWVQLGLRKFEITKQFVEDLEDETFTRRIRDLDAALLVYHSPIDEIVDVDEARKIYVSAKHPKSFVSLDGADHLLSKPADSEFVADTLCAWASRYLSAAPTPPVPAGSAKLPEGTVVVEEVNAGFENRVTTHDHAWIADEPASVGGSNLGPNPYDLLLSSLGACTSMTLRMYAKHKQLSVGNIRVTLKHSRIHAQDCQECESDTGRVDRIELSLRITGDLTEEQRTRILQIAGKCPVHKTLIGEKEIITRLEESTG